MRPDIINITQGRARIFPDTRYPGGGWFGGIPGVTGNNYSFAEKAGYYWLNLYQSGYAADIFNEGNLRSRELWYFPHGSYTNAATLSGYGLETFVTDHYEGIARRPFNSKNSVYQNYFEQFNRIRIDEETDSWAQDLSSGFAFNRRMPLGIRMMECVTTCSFGTCSISGIVSNYNNRSQSYTGLIDGFSGTINAYSFESGLNNGLDTYASGKFYQNSAALVWTSTTTGFESVPFGGSNRYFTQGEFYIKADQTGTSAQEGIRNIFSTDSWVAESAPNNSGQNLPIPFSRATAYYSCSTGSLIDEISIPRAPYVEIRLNERFSGESGFELYRATGTSSNHYLLYQIFDNASGSQTSGDYDYAETGNFVNTGINEFRGPLLPSHPSFNSGNSDLSGIQSQWIYRDYDVYPGVPVYYKSRAYQTYPDGSKQYSQYAFHEIAEFPKIVPTGFCTPYLTVIDSDNPDNVFTAVCQFSDSAPVYGISSDTFAPDWDYTAKILRRCQDVVAFSVGTGFDASGNATPDTKSGRYQADGWAYLRFIHTGDFRSAYTEKFLPIKFMSGNSSNFTGELASQPDDLSPNTEVTNWPNRAGDPHDS